MSYFLGFSIDKIIPMGDYNVFKDPFDINKLVGNLYAAYKNQKAYIITTKNISIEKEIPGVYYIGDKLNLYFTWEYVIKLNNFFCKKYTIDQVFQVDNMGYEIIFFVKFMNKHIKLLKKDGIHLIGNSQCHFGIISNRNNLVHNCKHLVFFSNNYHKFLFYRVIDKVDYVCGKIFNGFNVSDETIQYKEEYPIDIPDTFFHIRDNIYGIKKSKIEIEIRDNPNLICYNIPKYQQFCKMFDNRSFYFLKVDYALNKTTIHSLYQFILNRYPALDHRDNNLLIDPENIDIRSSHFVMIYLSKKTPSIILQLNQYLLNYVYLIISSIKDFFNKLYTNPTIVTDQYIAKYNNDTCIHIVSEFMYFFTIIFKLWKIVKNLKSCRKDQQGYIQANYVFDKKEISTFKFLAEDEDYSEYLKVILTRSISTFLSNYFLFIHNDDEIDIIPVTEDMSIDTIRRNLYYSKKANYLKHYLIEYLSGFFMKRSKIDLDIPVIFINITKIPKINSINLYKMYGNNSNLSIPITINVAYDDDKLIINMSYKKKYSKIKHLFSEILEEILE